MCCFMAGPCVIFSLFGFVCVCGYGLGNWFEQDWSEESLYDKVPSSSCWEVTARGV